MGEARRKKLVREGYRLIDVIAGRKISDHQERVRESHRFFSDRETSKTIHEFAKSNSGDDLVRLLPFVRLPFDKMWIEWYSGNDVMEGAFIETTDEENQWIVLIFCYSMTFFKTIQAAFVAQVSPSGKLDVTFSDEIEKQLDKNPHIERVIMAATVRLVSVLILMGQQDFVHREPMNRPPRTLNGTVQHDHPVTNINLRIPKEFIISEDGTNSDVKLYDKANGLSQRMQYEVMGSWHQHKPNEAELMCSHEFVYEEESTRRRRCIHCKKLAWWVRPHSRGNPELGIMVKDRHLRV